MSNLHLKLLVTDGTKTLYFCISVFLAMGDEQFDFAVACINNVTDGANQLDLLHPSFHAAAFNYIAH